ncbi:MAG: phosphopantetheine-binding protein, partial [Candidatus Parabeggiatoa sp.]|nr:phosphopantetheine-binding protein [Candidatus Parabeggiatoa sp.]
SEFTNEPTTGICYRQNEKQTHESVEELLAQGKVNKIAQLWVGGFDFDWETIYDLETKPHRISLPSYPFLKQRFWIGESLTSSVPVKAEPSEKITSSVSIQAESDRSEKIAEKVGTEKDLANKKALSPLLLELADAPEKEQEEMISAVLQKKVAFLLGFSPDYRPPLDEGFLAMVIESMQGLALQNELEETFQVEIADTAIFDYPDIRTFSAYLRELIPFDDLLIDDLPIDHAEEDFAPEPSEPLYDITDENLAYLYQGPLPDDILSMSLEEVETNLEREIQYFSKSIPSIATYAH